MRAARPSSPAESAPSLEPAMLLRIAADRHEAIDQRVLGLGHLFLAELAALARGLELEQGLVQPRLVGHLLVGLLLEALREPDRAADRSERQGEEAGDQAHGS